jgi:putative holliday junction resolvase
MITQKPILAIDYGQRRIGLAISDSKGIIASPLKVLEKTEKKKFENIIDEILDIIEEYRIKTIIIGMPQIFTTNHQESKSKIENFRNKLIKRTTLPIIFYDESYSTTEAQNMLLSLGQNTKSTKGKIDKISATVFLQEFLNSENKNNNENNS